MTATLPRPRRAVDEGLSRPPTAGRPDAPRLESVPLLAVELALAGALVAAVVGFHRLFVGREWVLPLVADAVLAHLLAGALRRRGIGVAVSGLVCLAAGALALCWFHVGSTTTFGVPLGESFDAIESRLRDAWNQFGEISPPTEPLDGFLLTAGAAIWVAAWLADTAAFRLSASFEALLPSGAVFVFTAVLARDQPWVTASLVYITVALVFVLLHRIHHQTNPVVGPATSGIDPRLRLGAALVIGAVALGSVAAPHLPGAGGDPWVDVDEDDTSTTRDAGDPIVDVAQRLLALSEQEMFTVRSDQRSYWRLTSLDTLVDSQWTLNQSFSDADGALDGVTESPPNPRELLQQVTISGLSNVWLPAAYEPQEIDAEGLDVGWDSDSGSLLVGDGNAAPGMTYTVRSLDPTLSPELLAAAGDEVPDDIRERYLQLPADFSPEVVALAQELTGGATSRYEAARLLQDFFRSDAFTYTEEPPPLTRADPFEDFLFESRAGFCQQFAGTYAAMARAVGLPTRLAVGFTAGEQDPADPTLFHVLGVHAHTWPEVYFDGVGWVGFEPTQRRGRPNAEAYTGVPEQQAAAEGGGVATTVPPPPETVVDPTTPEPPGDVNAGSTPSTAPEAVTPPTTSPPDDPLIESLTEDASRFFLWGLVGTFIRALAVLLVLALLLVIRWWVRRGGDGELEAVAERARAAGRAAGASPMLPVSAGLVLLVVVGVVATLAVAVLFVATSLLRQELRARHRRAAATTPNTRTRAAWLDAVEALDALGVGPRRYEAPVEFARRGGSVLSTGALLSLARHVERADYAPGGVGDDEAADAVQHAAAIVHEVHESTSWHQRLRARLDPRPPEARGREEGPRIRITAADA